MKGRKINQEVFAIVHIRNEGRSGLGQLQRGLNTGNEFWEDFGCDTTEVSDD